MKKVKKNIILVILVYVVLNLAEIPIYKSFVNKSINDYINAQGLKNEEILRDTKLVSPVFLSPFPSYSRRIIFKNNPNVVHEYSKSTRRYPLIPFVSSIVYKMEENKNEDHYKNILFYLQDRQGSSFFSDSKFNMWIDEGLLDRNGNLISIMTWRKFQSNEIYDENDSLVKEFVGDINEYLKTDDILPDDIRNLAEFKDLRELYDYLITDKAISSDLSYDNYLQLVIEEKRLQEK